MNRHTTDMLHDVTTHEAIRQIELLLVLTAAIVVLHGILYHAVF